MEIKNFFAQDAQGNIMPSADCYLYLPGTTTLATGLVNVEGLPIANPFKASLIGQVEFGAPNGVYDLRIARGARDTTIRIQCADLLQAIENTSSILGVHATPPTARNDGTPLQVADTYYNSTTQLSYIYKSTGWEVNNVDGQALASPTGATIVGAVIGDYNGTVQDAINDLQTLEQTVENLSAPDLPANTVVVPSVQSLLLAKQDATQIVRTLSWYAGLNKGGLSFSWSPTTPKSRHNGGTIISPTVPYVDGDQIGNFLSGAGETNPGGNGCWIADIFSIKYSALYFGAKADGVIGDGSAGANDGFSINAALKGAESQGIGRVYLGGVHRTRQTAAIPSYVTIAEGAIQVATNWFGGSPGRKAITNADTTNGNIACGVDGVTIRGLPGSEFDHGIHFCKTTSAVINKPNIADVSGDGICIGNITGGVNGLCVGTLINSPVIRRAGRQGIAMTNARGTRGSNVDIADLSGAILNAGVAIDWEPDSSSDECSDNVFIGGFIRNVKEGATMASVASLPESLTKGNAVIGMSIDTTQGDGIRSTYSNTLISGNILSNIGKNGIYVTSSAGVMGSIITDNNVISCSAATALTYDAYRLGGTAHCIFTGNISRATQARWSLFTESSSQNVISNNNFRSSSRTWNLTAGDLSAASHNILSGNIESSTHQGFVAGGPISMGNQPLILGGVSIIVVSDVPGTGAGVDGNVAFNTGVRVGTSLWYKRIGGVWKPASPALT